MGVSATGGLPCHLDQRTHEWALDNLPFLTAVFEAFDLDSAWPSIDGLQRNLVRRAERLNVSETAWNLPRDLGHTEALPSPALPSEQQIVLSLFALRYVESSEPLLESFVRFLRLTSDRYRSASGSELVIVRRGDLNDPLGLGDVEAIKLSHVLLRGVRFLGGGTMDIETWERTVHEPALVPLLDVEEIDSYLAIEASTLHGRAALLEPPSFGLGRRGRSHHPSAVPVGLHPAIQETAVPLFEDGHFAEAVEKGYKVVRDRLRELTGYETGSEAFGRGGLRISGAAAPHVEHDFNEGVRFLMMAIDKFRNEKSHSSDGLTTSPDRAREYLSLSSLAMHLLDQALTGE